MDLPYQGYMLTSLSHKRFQISNDELLITHRKTKVGERKLSLLAVEQVDHSHPHPPHDNNLVFYEKLIFNKS